MDMHAAIHGSFPKLRAKPLATKSIVRHRTLYDDWFQADAAVDDGKMGLDALGHVHFHRALLNRSAHSAGPNSRHIYVSFLA